MKPNFPYLSGVFLAATLLGTVARAETLENFFDGNSLHDIHLEMSVQDWQTIHERYLEDTYYRCTFTWNGHKLNGVGIRSRGSQSRSPIKPSIGLDFGKFASGQRFLGLKSLVLRNLNQDASMMRERLVEAVFARMGLPSSREAHARLYMNGEYAGVYLMVEPFDAHYLQTRFGEDSGYLYEFNMPDPPFRFNTLSPEAERKILDMFEPKTRSDSPDAEGLLEMIRFVNEAGDSEFASGVNRYVDAANFLAHAAVEQVLVQWDGLLGYHGMNNFYFYRWNKTRQGIFLVWDQDGAFTDIWTSIWFQTNGNVLMHRLLAIPEMRQRYLDALEDAIDVMLHDDWFAAEVERIYRQIRGSVYEDKYKLCRGPEDIVRCTNEEFEADVDYLRDFARYRPLSVRQELAAARPNDANRLRLEQAHTTGLGAGTVVLAPYSLAKMEIQLPVDAVLRASGPDWRLELNSVSVEVEGVNVPLVEVGPGGVVFLVPESIACGPRTVTISYGNRLSNAAGIEIRPSAAGVLAVTHAGGEPVTREHPGHAGEVLVAYATGVWPGISPDSLAKLTVELGTLTATVVWAGAAPGFPGLEQVNFSLPAEIASVPGVVPLVLLWNGEPGSTFELPIL
ncbi:MAG: CotH kinase family protein [Bryobacterales bacterium]|nr:CotH kinase family protein [Bryobacterales bacterium]